MVFISVDDNRLRQTLACFILVYLSCSIQEVINLSLQPHHVEQGLTKSVLCIIHKTAFFLNGFLTVVQKLKTLISFVLKDVGRNFEDFAGGKL